MTRFHPITSFSLFFNLVAIVLFVAGFPFTASTLCILTFFATFVEVKRYTSSYQFILVYVACILPGIFLDHHYRTPGYFTACFFFAATTSILRFILFRYFTFTRFQWVEPLLLILSGVCYIMAIKGSDYSIAAILFPLPIYGSAVLLAFTFLQDKKQLLEKKIRGLEVGKKAVEFDLPDQDGNMVKLSDFKNERHVLLIFVRGDWCPCCHMMLRTYEKNNEKFKSKNIFVMAIGPDPVGVNRTMVERLGLDYKVLSDADQKTAMKYGVQFKDYENTFKDEYQEGIPLPASFLIDKDSTVRYVSRPDKVGEFLNPSLIFPIVEKLR